MKFLTSFLAGLAIGIWIACYGGLPCPASSQAMPDAEQADVEQTDAGQINAARISPSDQYSGAHKRWPVTYCLRMASTPPLTAVSAFRQILQSPALHLQTAPGNAAKPLSFDTVLGALPDFFYPSQQDSSRPPTQHAAKKPTEKPSQHKAETALQTKKTAGTPSPQKTKAAARNKPAPATQTASQTRPDAVYARALEAYHQGRYDAARNEFSGFLASFSTHPLHANALYWAGECWYAQGRYELARQTFAQVVQLHPKHAKSPDALLKEAYCLIRQGQKQEALRCLDTLDSRYPASHAARLGAEARKQWQRSGERHG